MSKRISTICFLAAVFPAAAWSSANDQLWEITTKMDMTGMDMPEVIGTICMRSGDAYSPGRVPHQKHCKITDLNAFAGITTWNIHCTGPNAMTGSGKVTINKKTIIGTMNLRSKDIEMHQVISGKLVGTCQK